MKYGYAESDRAETWFNIDGSTREEAAANAFKKIDGPVVFICECKPIDKLAILTSALNWSDLFERADEIANEDHCPWFENTIFDDRKKSIEELKQEVRNLFSRWLKRYPGADVWCAENITEHTMNNLFIIRKDISDDNL